MAGSNLDQALDEYIERARTVLSCLAPATAFGSGSTINALHSLVFYSDRHPYPNRLKMRTHGGGGEIVLRVTQHYSINHQPHAITHARYEVWTTFYHYKILDRSEREIIAFHWEPSGRTSPNTRPHVHVPAAEPVILPQPDGSPVAGRKTYLNKLHLPTGRIGLEDVIEFLITDLQVVPRLPNWNEILDEARPKGNR